MVLSLVQGTGLVDGVVWYGMLWYGMVWYGMVWYGMVWYGMVWYGSDGGTQPPTMVPGPLTMSVSAVLCPARLQSPF